uniref:Uncharacterized protein n=1 Tax=Onchocerca volvulus TaxID=6282 RepID=A0A8R1XQZ7_ONCVO
MTTHSSNSKHQKIHRISPEKHQNKNDHSEICSTRDRKQ